jgi:predicted MPP superfamily phosphohydrolase
MYIEAKQNRVISHTLHFNDLPQSFENFTIFFISDVHRRIISHSIIEKANSADVVVIGGDLAEKGVPLTRIKENILTLSKISSLYFVWGNNDYELDETGFLNLLQDSGVHILDNECVQVKIGSDTIDLLGINDLSLRKADLNKAVSACLSSFRILVSHNPGIVKSIRADQQIRLILSGHTHGGQIRFGPFGIAKKGGLYRSGSYMLFISNGYGTRRLPLRLGAQSETNLITLKQAKSLQ